MKSNMLIVWPVLKWQASDSLADHMWARMAKALIEYETLSAEDGSVPQQARFTSCRENWQPGSVFFGTGFLTSPLGEMARFTSRRSSWRLRARRRTSAGAGSRRRAKKVLAEPCRSS